MHEEISTIGPIQKAGRQVLETVEGACQASCPVTHHTQYYSP